MIGAVIIDGTDIATLGAFIIRGGDNGFIMLPETKEVDANDWPEENGLEPDLTNLVFAARKFTVKYYLSGDYTTFKTRLASFENLHFQPGYREIYIREFDKTFQLRFAGFSGYNQTKGFAHNGQKAAFIDVDYWLDDPVQFLAAGIIAPVSDRENAAQVSINDIDLSNFNIVVRNIYTSAMKSKPKDPLLQQSKYISGLTADMDAPVKKQMAEVVIQCTMFADDLATFWTNYNALWGNLSAGQITLSLTAAFRSFYCYYIGMEGFEKLRPFNQRIKVNFNLRLAAYDIAELMYLLAAEDGSLITTEDGYCIDLEI